MKLRIRDDSLRLRLSVPEVASIGTGRAVEACTRFPDTRSLVYRLVPSADVTCLDARFEAPPGLIEVRLPADEGRRWSEDDHAVSLRGTVSLGGADALELLVEKDFACLDPSGDEDQSDLFANPNAAC